MRYPRTWTLARFADGFVCRALGDFDKSSEVERIEVIEIAPFAASTMPGHDRPAPTDGRSE